MIIFYCYDKETDERINLKTISNHDLYAWTVEELDSLELVLNEEVGLLVYRETL